MAATKRVIMGATPEVVGGTIDWTIPNFTKLGTCTNQTTSYELNMGGGRMWKLGFSSSPSTSNPKDRAVTFRLEVRKLFDPTYEGSVNVRYKLSIVDDAGNEVYHQGSDDFRSKETFKTRLIELKDGHGSLTEDISTRRIWSDWQTPLLYNDTLNVRMLFEYVDNAALTCIISQIVALPRLESDCVMASDYMKLYKSKEGTDFILVAEDGKEFAVHRTVLQARSDYFRAMLTLDCKEAKEGRCPVLDVNAEVLEVLLLFMYGGLTEVPAQLAQSVLIASDKYQFPILKGHCEAMLMSQVMIGTAAHFLILADKYSAPKLREACLKLITGGFKVFNEAGGMRKLQADGNADLLKVVKDMVCAKPPS